MDTTKKAIDILGTDYRLRFNSGENLEKEESGACNVFSKRIDIREKEGMLEGEASEKDFEIRFNQVMRHEVLHVFFYESGMENWAYDEVLTEYLAIQFPKLLKLFEELECER